MKVTQYLQCSLSIYEVSFSQSSLMHSIVSIPVPLQEAPPCGSMGFVHNLLLDLMPNSSQPLDEHELHLVQDPHFPFNKFAEFI